MTIKNEFEQERHRLLTRFLSQAQESNDPTQQELAINQIVVTVLRSRPLCRRFNGTPLTGVYQEIYNQAKESLLNYLRRSLASIKPNRQQITSKPIKLINLYQLQQRIFRELLDDNRLKQMGMTAQKYPINSELRSYALTELVKGIKLSGLLCRPHVTKFSANLYRTLYEEAIAETLAYVCLNIDLYDPNRGNGKFMTWVNFKLDKSLLKCYSDRQKYAKYELHSFENLEQIQQPESNIDLRQILQEYLLHDPDNIFSTVHIRNRPDANFSAIAIAKFSGQSWEQISGAWEIPIPTLSSFYNRWCRRFAPLLKTELKQYL